MCNGFGGIVTMDGRVLFCEPDNNGDCSHSELLGRAKIKDNTKLFPRYFVRFEFPDWTAASFRWDENESLPGWLNDEHYHEVNNLLERVGPFWAEYKRVRDAARAEYERVTAPAWAEYKRVRDAARAEYERVTAPAWAEYERVTDAARAEFINRLSGIRGYVPK